MDSEEFIFEDNWDFGEDNLTSHVLRKPDHNVDQIQTAIMAIVAILILVTCLFGIFINGFVIYAYLRFQKLRTITNLLIFHRAIFDLCVNLGLPFLVLTLIIKIWPFGEILCKLYHTFSAMSHISIPFFLFFMTVERYIALCHPRLSLRLRTTLCTNLIGLFVWVISAVIMYRVFIYSQVKKMDLFGTQGVQCHVNMPQGEDYIFGLNAFQFNIIYLLFWGFFIPLVFTLLFYFLILIRMKEVSVIQKHGNIPLDEEDGEDTNPQDLMRNNFSPNGRGQGRNEESTSIFKVTKMILIIIPVNFVLWTPFWILSMMIVLDRPIRESIMFHVSFMISGYLYFASSTITPILYIILSESFKKCFKNTFSCCCCCCRFFCRKNNQVQVNNGDDQQMTNPLQVEVQL